MNTDAKSKNLQDTKVKINPLVEPTQPQLLPIWPFTTNDNHKRFFLSYSHDDEEHQRWVFRFCDDLRKLGIDAIADNVLRKGGDWIDFMDKGIANAHKVLIIGTPKYKLKSERESGGVKYENSIIKSSLLYGLCKEKYIPVLRTGEFVISFPSNISNINGYDMRDDSSYPKVLQDIKHEIYDKSYHQLSALADVPDFTFSSYNENEWKDKRNQSVDKPVFIKEGNTETASKEKSQNQLNANKKELVNNLFKDEGSIKSFIDDMRQYLFQFEKGQLKIEAIRLGTSNNERITPTSLTIRNIWADGYKIIHNINNLISHLQKSVTEEYLAEARAIEAFVYYNMAMLWGNMPVVKSIQLSGIMRVSQSRAEDVYRYCLELLKKCPSIQSLDNGHVTDSFVNILYTELYLSLGQKDLAYSHLKKVSSFNNSIFTLNVVDKNETKSPIDIYTKEYVELLKEEVEGKDNSDVWFDRGAIYGTWAALKRLDKAQALTGIKDYELLLPIPQSEVYLDPHIRQNPEY